MAVERPMTLTVDRREYASSVPALLARQGVVVTTASLACGDYVLGRTLGVERKTGQDFARSVIDGRLFRQMGALRTRYKRPLLLVESLTQGKEVLGVPWAALRGALVSTAVAFGVPALRSADPEESAELILTAMRQLQDPVTIPYVRPGYRPRGWRRRALYILQGLPGVGPRRASALLAEFGSVAAVAAADASALAQVRGLGPGVARSMCEALGPEPSR